MGFECGTDFPPHTASRTVAGSLPRRDAMTSPTSTSGRLRASRRRYVGSPRRGITDRLGVSSPGRPWEERRPECIGGDDERQLQEAGHTPAARLGMTETADTQRVQTQLPDLEITLPARAENVAVVRHAVGGLGEVLEVDDQTLSDIKLAVTEACTNVVVHAYPERRGPDGPARVDRRAAACRSWSPTAGAASCRGPTARGSASACRSSPRWPSRSSSAPGAPRRPRCG